MQAQTELGPGELETASGKLNLALRDILVFLLLNPWVRYPGQSVWANGNGYH